nr:4'-phosphopantetheinyl transferase superfamily protein [Allomuricauda sp.]
MLKVVCAKSSVVFYDYSEVDWNSSDVKLFKIKLSGFEGDTNHLISFLQKHEVLRAQRYHFKKDYNRFVVCRAFLKFLLAKQTGLAISDISIDSGSNKKPYLSSNPEVFFNVSHSGDCALIAIGNTELGVDVEQTDRNFDFMQIVLQAFSEVEIKELTKSKDQLQTFYTFWTRKEAIVKATGKGIDDSFKEIPAKDGLHLKATALLGTTQNLQVNSFKFDQKYVGSLAFTNLKPGSQSVRCFNINHDSSICLKNLGS